MMSDELDHELDSLVDQLKQTNKENKQAAAQPEDDDRVAFRLAARG